MAEREKSALYPGSTWEDCMEFIRIVADFKFNSVAYSEVAKKYNLSNPTAKSFTSKISSCKQFGLISTSGGNTLQLTETAKRLVFPTGEVTTTQLECFALPPLYSKLITSYDGKALPSNSILANLLMSEHKITKSVKDAAAKCFLESAEQLDIIRGGVLCYAELLSSTYPSASSLSPEESNTNDIVARESSQEFENVVPSLDFSKESDYITQSIPVESGKVAKFMIPVDATKDDLLLLRDMFDVLLKRKFKITFDNE